MEQVSYTQAEPRQRREDAMRLVEVERELLDAFRHLSSADQGRILLLTRSMRWAAGPLPHRK